MATTPFPKSTSVAGEGRVVVKPQPNGTPGVETITYQYPLKLISPSAKPNQKSVLVFLLSYGGGLVGGDQVSLEIDIQPEARLSIATQGHTKIFKSPSPDVITRQKLSVAISRGAALCLLPDPVQPFQDSVYEQTQIFSLAPDASLCLLDWVTQGRSARDENWSFLRWRGKNEVWVKEDDPAAQGRLLVRDSVILQGDDKQVLHKTLRETMQGRAVFGTLILRGPLMNELGKFFMAEFAALPRLGARYFHNKSNDSSNNDWRKSRLEVENQHGILWSAANIRGCVVVKIGSATVEGARLWLGSVLSHQGDIARLFDREALMEAVLESQQPGPPPGGLLSKRRQNLVRLTPTAQRQKGLLHQNLQPTANLQLPHQLPPQDQPQGRLQQLQHQNPLLGASVQRLSGEEKQNRIASFAKPREAEAEAAVEVEETWQGGVEAVRPSSLRGREPSVVWTGPKPELKLEDGYGRPDNRLNADQLHQLSPEQEDAIGGKTGLRKPSQIGGIMPVGLLREPHKQKELVVATTAELEARGAEGTRATATDTADDEDGNEDIPDDERITAADLAKARELAKQDTEPWQGAPSGEVPMVKTEDGTLRPMNIDEAIKIAQVKDRKEREEAKEKEKWEGMTPLERKRIEKLNQMLSSLGTDPKNPTSEPENKDGRLFLFQIPPVMPQLARNNRPAVANPVKSEPADDDDISMLDAPPAGQPTPTVDLTEEDLPGKGPITPEAGYIGKMHVRKSGKVELDWGGQSMSVKCGLERESASNVLIIEKDDAKNQGQVVGSALSMGRLAGNFVAGLNLKSLDKKMTEVDFEAYIRSRNR
ncbi:putative urease accessory protein [Zalerion maritima]|uniref:Urease accessory protein n=1 Tax=Zalerion maritima TaxID=339359 RepID=A0AAD5WX42_9PEZI|nr:putative urease accessory protein [Zalerion maritima]